MTMDQVLARLFEYLDHLGIKMRVLLLYHAWASVCSNGIWFVTNFLIASQVFKALETGSFVFLAIAAVAYVATTTAGSCWMMARLVLSTQASGLVTSDLRWPVWPYYLLAWLGLVAAVLLLVVRVARLAAGRPVASVDSAARGQE